MEQSYEEFHDCSHRCAVFCWTWSYIVDTVGIASLDRYEIALECTISLHKNIVLSILALYT
jgi:hypothetical protein